MRNLKRAMADTYGGKIQQETLRMYIGAVEKGDFELANKYFIFEKQAEELENSHRLANEPFQRYTNNDPTRRLR